MKVIELWRNHRRQDWTTVTATTPCVGPARLLRFRLRTWTARIVVGLALLCVSGIARGQSEIAGWGTQVFDSAWSKEPFAGIAAGGQQTVSLRSDGSIVAW